jgi:MerR family transcriptional regulator, light-induced transcriptional regulator
MDRLMLAERAAARLIAETGELAREITAAMYAESPDLLAKYGPVGRERCLEDMHFNLQHLAPAVELGKPSLFASYAVWLEQMLAARNVGTDDVVRSLVLTEREIRSRFPADEAAVISECLLAGLHAIGRGAEAG